MRTNTFLFLVLASLLVGCGTHKFTLKHSALPSPTDRRDGNLSIIKFADKRDDKQKVGVLHGGFGNSLGDLVLTDDLETSLTAIFNEVLEKVGYSMTTNAKVTLEGEIREFSAGSDGWSKNAKEKIRVRLLDKQGQILWEKTLIGEDGGMVFGPSSVEQSMNVALDKLLRDAIEEFSSEFFYQNIKKAN